MPLPARRSRTANDAAGWWRFFVPPYGSGRTPAPSNVIAALEGAIASFTAGVSRGLECVGSYHLLLGILSKTVPEAAVALAGGETALATICAAFPAVHDKTIQVENWVRGKLAAIGL